MIQKTNTLRRTRHFLGTTVLAGTTALIALGGAAASDGDDAGEKDEKWDVSQPPGEWRNITIDTRETTWSNVDVSSDGRTIVFDALGDIYRVSIEGGEAEALTDGIEWNYQPRFSPDGSTIVFVSDRAGGDNLWIMDVDGTDPREVTSEKEHLVHNPSFSPDGQYIVAKKSFMSTRSIPAGEIWLFHRGGGKGLNLIERPNGKRDQKNIAEPSYSPDGRYVYFSQDTTAGRVWQYGKDSTGQIFVIRRLELATGEVEAFAGGPGGAIRPTPSPDGRQLAFVKRLPGLVSAIYLKDLESGHERPLYEEFERDLQETSGSEGNAPSIAWTPDSRSIVFWTGGKIRRVDVASGESTVIPIHLRVEKKIQPALRFQVEVAPERVRLRMPRWVQYSPTGERVLFQALGYLWIRDTASGEPRRLTAQQEHFETHPSFSNDGRWVVYATWNDRELGSVSVVSADGGEGRKLTTQPGHYVEPRFSSDGESVVYRKLTGGYLTSPDWSMDPGIWIAKVDGGDPKRIAKSGSNPAFAAASDRVYFNSRASSGGLALESVDLDGHERRKHLEGSKVTEFSVSPDDRWIAFTEQYDAWVAPFAATGKTVEVSTGMKSIPVRRVSKRAGEFLTWSGDGSRLHWQQGPVLYSRELRDVFAFLDGAPDELPEPVAEGLDVGFDVEADQPTGSVAFTGARVVTMRDAWNQAEVIEDGVVVVEGNRIVAVGPAGDVEVPSGAFLLDLRGKTIVPGLLDAHAHGAMGRSELIPQQNWTQYANLAFGVTTIHDPSNDTSTIFAASEMQKTGGIVAPRIFSTGSILYGAHVPGLEADIDDLDDGRFHVQRLKDAGAISVKSYQHPRRDERQQIIAAARELGIMVVPEGGMKFQHNMTELVDGHTSIEHSLTIKHAYEDVLQLWSQTAVGYTPTFVVSFGGLEGERYWYQHDDVWANERLRRWVPGFVVEPRSMRRTMAPEEHYNHVWVARTAKQLLDRGVSVQIGAHGQLAGLAAHWELWMMEQGGFTPWEALRGGTIGGARHFGLDREIGSIESGKLADLIVIDGNPLEDLRRTEFVAYTMINGRLFDATTMNEIGNVSNEREPFFFERRGGSALPAQTLSWLEDESQLHGCPH